MIIVCLEFFVVLSAVAVGLLVYKRLLRSPKFSQIVTEIVEPPADTDVIADMDVARANAECRAKFQELKADAAEQAAGRIRRRL